MPRRDTGTGAVLEGMIIPALRRAGYHWRPQVNIGPRLGGARGHFIDALAWDGDGGTFLVSLKWQQTSGTAEQKVPFEVMCLAEAVRSNQRNFEHLRCIDCEEPYASNAGAPLRSYLVLGGEGWTLRDFYVAGGLNEHMTYGHLVAILSLEAFVARANLGQL